MVSVIDRSPDNPARVELEPDEILLAEQILTLAVIPSDERSREDIETLLANPLFREAISEFFQPESVPDEIAASYSHDMLDEIRDEFLVFPVTLARDEPEAQKRRAERLQHVGGVYRADATEILEIVLDYANLPVSTIHAIVARDVLCFESVFDASLRFLKTIAQECDHEFPETEITNILELYLDHTDFLTYPPAVRSFFQRKIAEVFRVPRIFTNDRNGQSHDLVLVACVDTALALLQSLTAEIEMDEHGQDESRYTPPPQIDSRIIDEYMALLAQRL